ncbi:Cof-type HAD-IIB family hydrolase [Sabulilitoribacter multivorans]|uniref:Cof-type HAD-IIB family hydrolase n=1 Tax=Flaviramulus multivorans TaxID=1304750 RepID=A0ABS9IMB4_9FLAO|nr:HAD family hydrolase [Flaviramulus multivorans]MCF7561736.1 Cof-type HAD-IIB family hydrolase [Flaviramulus multivorans]
MNLSQIKLVVTDMDGTLLNSNHEVSSLFFELFNELKKHNVFFVAASGRPYYSIVDKLNSIKDDIIIVAENGGLVIRKDELLLSTPIKRDNLLEIEALIESKTDIHPIFCTKAKAYFSHRSSSNGYFNSLLEYYPNYAIIKSTKEIKEDIIKIALYNSEDSEKQIYPHFKHLEPNYKVKISGKHWVDVSDDLAHKGHAIELIQEKYNISPEETLVFGDYNNDIEMLKRASYSFAMENAHKNVKEVANYTTKSNDDFGVEFILKKLIESKVNYRKL